MTYSIAGQCLLLIITVVNACMQVGPDILCTGYLPASGGLLALVQELEGPGFEQKIQDALRAGSNSGASPSPSSHSSGGSTAAGSSGGCSGHGAGSSGADDVSGSATSGEVRFYKVGLPEAS